MSIEEVRHQRGIRMTFSEAVSTLAVLVALFSALNGWFVLPEQMRHVKEENVRQNIRIDSMESLAADRAETLARIDERTKRMEQTLTNGTYK